MGVAYRWLVETEFPCTLYPSIGQFNLDATRNIYVAFSEELKSSLKGCPCSGRLSLLKNQTNDIWTPIYLCWDQSFTTMRSATSMKGIIYYMRIIERYMIIWAKTLEQKHQPGSPQRLKDFLQVLCNIGEVKTSCEWH